MYGQVHYFFNKIVHMYVPREPEPFLNRAFLMIQVLIQFWKYTGCLIKFQGWFLKLKNLCSKDPRF
jgi:hypothetical protein